METEPASKDSNSEPAPPHDESQQDGQSGLLLTMNRLSLKGDTEPLPTSNDRSPLNSPARAVRKSPSMTAIQSTRSPSRHTSGSANVPQSPGSPGVKRRTSGLLSSSHAVTSPSRPSLSRSASSASLRSSFAAVQSPSSPAVPEPPVLTAAAVAAAYLSKDLLRHEDPNYTQILPNTIVIVHDSCYGHRFARPKTTKSTLSLIVERPERIQAGMLGVACAYTRLGGRHAGGGSDPHPQIEPTGAIPFYIRRTNRIVPLTSLAVTNVHGSKWMLELESMCDAAEARLSAGAKELARPDDPAGSHSKPRLHEGDLYLCKESLDAFQGALGGVYDAVDAIFQDSGTMNSLQRAFVCIRPPGHHCSSDFPSGFCWLNNVHVGIEHAVQSYGLTHVAIIDFDLHHGDGSQTITWERNARPFKSSKNAPPQKRASIGYFSIHDINSYPCEYGDTEKVQSASLCIENAHNQTIWNVHLQPWKTEDEFWNLYETRYLTLLDKARAFLRSQTERFKSQTGIVKPKGAIFLSAGFDASEWEGQGMQRHKVNVPTSFYARFTADVIKLAQEEGVGVEGRVISVLEGGYSDRAIASGVFSHITGLVDPAATSRKLSQKQQMFTGEEAQFSDCRSSWWNEDALKELERKRVPVPPPEPPKKPRYAEPPTYTSPTQSFTAKVVDPSKVHRSISTTIQNGNSVQPQPIQPPPEVDWATSAVELSKLLIPSDRQINSCTHDQLTEPKVKRERHSSIGVLTAELQGERRQTRGRRVKLPDFAEVDSEAEIKASRVVSQTARRQTMPDASVLMNGAPSSLPGSFAQPTVQSRRRSSVTSASMSTNGDLKDVVGNESAVLTLASQPGALKIKKTRRASGANAIKQDVLAKATTAKPLPSSEAKAASIAAASSAETSNQQSHQDSSVDQVTTVFKKLILKMPPKEAQDAATAAASKPARKSAAPKAPRAAAPPRKPAARMKKTPVQTPVKAAVRDQQQDPKQMDFAQTHTPQTVLPVTHPITETNSEQTGLNFKREESIRTTSIENMDHPAYALHEADALKTRTQSDCNPATTPLRPDAPNGSFTPITLPITTEQPATTTLPEAKLDPLHPREGTPKSANRTDFIAYEPPRTSSARSPTNFAQEPLVWLPHNTATPAALRRGAGKENLPVFSASGHIPFAVSGERQESADPGLENHVEGKEGSVNPAQEIGNVMDVWEVPVTPK